MAVADNDILDILRRGTTTPLDFHYDQLTAPPIGMVFSEEDIMQLYKIATSVRLAGNAKKRLKMIDDVMKFRGCFKLAGGTNRVVYYHPDVPGVVYKVAIDAVGIKDNPAEFINQNFIKPFCCKVFECHPTGVIASFERLDRITSFLEFYSVADDVYQLITKVLIGKYVLEDIGTDYFMNFSIRRGFGVCIVDFPYCYELDGGKLICQHVMPDGKVCGGEIDYDEGFNHLICTKCGTEYFARDLAKKGDNKKVLVVKKGMLNNMQITVRRGDKIIKKINTNTTVDHLEKVNMEKRSEKAMLVASNGGNDNGRPMVTIRRGGKIVGGTQVNNYSDPGSTENKPFKNPNNYQKQNNAHKSIPMPGKNDRPAEKRVENPKANGIPTTALEVILDNFRVVNETLNKINERIDHIEDFIVNNTDTEYISTKLEKIENMIDKGYADTEENIVKAQSKVAESIDELAKNMPSNNDTIVDNSMISNIDKIVTEVQYIMRSIEDLKNNEGNATVEAIRILMTDIAQELLESDKKTYNLVQNFLDSLDINIEEEDNDEVVSDTAIVEDIDESSNKPEVANIEELDQFAEEHLNREYPNKEIIVTEDDHSDLEATKEATPNQEQETVTYSSDDENIPDLTPNNSGEKVSLGDIIGEY